MTRHSYPFRPRGLAIDHAQGARVTTDDGRTLVDLGGASHGVANFGHNHPRILDALRRQADEVLFVPQGIGHGARDEFLKALHGLLPHELSSTCFANSGTEAIDAAIKYAMAATGRHRVLAFRNGFHGRSLGATAATWRPNYRRPFEARLGPTEFVPYNDVDAATQALTDDTALVIVEPVQGEGGVHVPDPGYLAGLAEATRRAGALLVVDEIQTGLGRTGRDLAIHHDGITPDLLVLGKSLAGGLPMATVSMRQEVADAMPAHAHGSTFAGAPLACRAATQALGILADERLSERAARLGQHVLERLAGIQSPLIRDIRGQGLMLGIELRTRAGPVLQALDAAGFLVLNAGPNTIRLLPPLTIEEDDLHAGLNELERQVQALEALHAQ